MSVVEELRLFDSPRFRARTRPRGQVLKWVGNKFRYAELITKFFPTTFNTYFEPFVGTGAVAATLCPERGIAGDSLAPLVELMQLVKMGAPGLIAHYDFWRTQILREGARAYLDVRARYNDEPNAADLLIVSRTCYGGIMRFTRDGKISTPLGPHTPMAADKLAIYIEEWRARLGNVAFVHQDFADTIALAGDGDLIYCDPPYIHGQSILYGAQDFQICQLWEVLGAAADRGAFVAVSIDGHRRSGQKQIGLSPQDGLFEREILIDRGGCMLRRFQLAGASTAGEGVADRLLLSW